MRMQFGMLVGGICLVGLFAVMWLLGGCDVSHPPADGNGLHSHSHRHDWAEGSHSHMHGFDDDNHSHGHDVDGNVIDEPDDDHGSDGHSHDSDGNVIDSHDHKPNAATTVP